ncbi:MAG TPA: ATP-binding protein [Dehalococcoidia bacterium]|nr:ATP-binding protein [Dehalococcoidia bacterium]
MAIKTELPIIEQPAAPASLAELGLDLGFVSDLTLKTLYFGGNISGADLCERLALPVNVVGEITTFLRRERLCEVTGGTGISAATLNYALADAGIERATAALQMSGYVGPAPVPLETYFEYVHKQSIANITITREDIESALAPLVFDQRTVDLMGQAISSKRAFLVHGPSGNGKSAAADLLAQVLPGYILIPHAVQVMHQVIQVYDPSSHQAVSGPNPRNSTGQLADQRWVAIRRPAVFAAGELAASHLELVLDEVHKTYEAPIQMKANGGLRVIDDFGRQHLDAAYLINRWIVPLEKGVDNLSLHNGGRFQVPFDVIPMFITNKHPSELADDAFLRRIRYKVHVPGPDDERFMEILRRECERQDVEYHQSAAQYLIKNYFKKPEREMRGSQPRDLVEAIEAAASYQGTARALTNSNIDEACTQYFV